MPKGGTRHSDNVTVDNEVSISNGTFASTQSGTWTVQPGDTANTTAWKVDGSAVTQPASIAGTVVVDGRRGVTMLFSAISVSSSGDNTIIAADATKKIKVVSFLVAAALATDVIWKSDTTAISGTLSIGVTGSIASPYGSVNGWIMETAVNKALKLNLSAANTVSGTLAYFLEA